MSANVESMFYAGREKPWHGLGTQVEEAPTSADALRLAGLDWTVQRKPIQVCGGRKVDNFFAVFRVIIAGGRDFDDYQLLKATMDKLLCNITDEITVVCGQAKGADTLGEQYAMEKGYAIDYYPAQWKLYGKRAGYLRNEQMAQNADALAAFWNGESRGTKHMIELAKRYGLKVRVKRY